MSIFLLKTMQLLCCFMILVILHEGGHFLFAKLFGIRVKKFCLFFDPYVNWRLFSLGGTDYHIGWLPLGGYVHIAGMVDESTSAEDLEKDDTPREQMFMYKPAWQRLLVMVGGVLVNFITAMVIYSAIFLHWGEEYVPAEEMTYGYIFNDEAKSLGLRDGDILVAVDGEAMQSWSTAVLRDIASAETVTVLRDGQRVEVSLTDVPDLLTLIKQQPPFLAPAVPSIVDSVMTGGPADKAGMHSGDRVVAFDGKEVQTWNQLDLLILGIKDQIEAADGKAKSSLLKKTVVVERKGTQALDTLALTLTDDARLAVMKHNVLGDYKTRTIEYNVLTCIPAGIRHGWDVFTSYVSDLKYIFSKEGAKSVGSFGTIGSLFPDTWNWLRFWNLTAFISLMLAFMNFLPIPMLDGGYIFLTLLEIITRRKFPEKTIDRINTIGFYIVLGIMALGIFNDFARMVFHIY